MQRVIKRDGREVDFDKSKIVKALTKANQELVKSKQVSLREINQITALVEERCAKYKRAIKVEDINNLVEDELINRNYSNFVRAFFQYRYNKDLVRKANTTDDTILSLINLNNEEIKQENSNKNPIIASTQRDYMAGEVSKDITKRLLLPRDIVEAHNAGIIHFHDMDYYIQKIFNCDLVNLEDMLQNGTVISGTLIEKPHSFATACNIATQIIAQVASNQYGGQSISLAHLAPFVDASRQRLYKEVLAEQHIAFGEKLPNEVLKSIDMIVEGRVRAEVKRGVQTIQYQVNTLLSTNGQSPFITVFMYLNEAENEQTKKDLAMIIEETLNQRYQGVKNEKGVWITPAFPKLIYVLEEDNIVEGSEYYYLTELAAKCSAKRLVPDYISEKVMKEYKDGYCFPVMGCRSALSSWFDETVVGPDEDFELLLDNKKSSNEKQSMKSIDLWNQLVNNGEAIVNNRIYPTTVQYIKAKKYNGSINKCKVEYLEKKDDIVTIKTKTAAFMGRFNKGVVTINLPDVACSADGDNYNKEMTSFWKIFDERLELCHKALLCRYERLKGTISDVSPIHWQHGALARLEKGETIDKLLVGGYSTISLGYAGLWECVKELSGEDLTSEKGQELGLEIMQYMNDKCDKWNAQLNLGFGIYGTPMESATYKFAKALQERFGEIAGVSDRNFITNSYHVHVETEINPFDKLSIEAKFQKLSKGGAISYIEAANLEKNPEATMTIIKFIYNNIMYAEINTKSDYCQVCGWDHEIEIVADDHGKLIWRCPNCGNTDHAKMNIARRVCGYISTNDFNAGRMAEISLRYVHCDCHED